LDDQYGNYVIQHVLQFGRKSDRDVVLNIVAENGILGLSRQKFASNVIEKLLKYGNGDHRNAIVREMLKIVDDKTVETGRCSIVLLMVRDAYANYVVQTTLDVVPEGKDKENLLQELRNNSSKLVSCDRCFNAQLLRSIFCSHLSSHYSGTIRLPNIS
jgi:pumilio RNA-binding family